MRRLIFIVEGDSEQQFVNRHLVPYLSQKYPGVEMHAQKITTNRKKNVRGGNVNYALFKNEIKRTAAQGNVLITSFLDFFRLPNDFPSFSKDVKRIDEIEAAIRQDCSDILAPQFFLPYFQKHEFETLLFANNKGFAGLLDEKSMEKVVGIVKSFDTPEDINGGEETAPSKRLLAIFDYHKVADSILVMSGVDINELRKKCPRFDVWVNKLEEALNNGSFSV